MVSFQVVDPQGAEGPEHPESTHTQSAINKYWRRTTTDPQIPQRARGGPITLGGGEADHDTDPMTIGMGGGYRTPSYTPQFLSGTLRS